MISRQAPATGVDSRVRRSGCAAGAPGFSLRAGAAPQRLCQASKTAATCLQLNPTGQVQDPSIRTAPVGSA
jgi:hypothetical protein